MPSRANNRRRLILESFLIDYSDNKEEPFESSFISPPQIQINSPTMSTSEDQTSLPQDISLHTIAMTLATLQAQLQTLTN